MLVAPARNACDVATDAECASNHQNMDIPFSLLDFEVHGQDKRTASPNTTMASTSLIKPAADRVELKALQFCMMSASEIVASSAFQLTTGRSSGAEYGSVADPRGGASKHATCETCLMDEVHCPGHFGHLFIDSPVVHPLFAANAVSALRLICHRCHRLIFNKLRIQYEHMENVTGQRRIDRLQTMAKTKGLTCAHCDASVSQYKLMVYNPKPGSNAPKTLHIHRRTETPETGTVETPMTDTEVAEILEDVPRSDAALMGIDPSKFLVRVWPVIPLRCTKHNESGTRVDDLVTLLKDIYKLNAVAADDTQEDLVRILAQHDLREKLYTFVSNSENRKSSRADRGKPVEGIMDRIPGKHGLIRNNLMGKRSVMTARTVIGPDPTLKIDEVSFSRELARALTVPMTAHAANMDECRDLLRRGQVLKVTRGGRAYGVENVPDFEIAEGDVLARRLCDGDWVMMNRQPTLHRGSMIAFKARLRDTKTFGLNLAVTKSFNADFDGDNMNGMVPQSAKVRAEVAELSSVHANMIVGTRANVCVVQDGLTGAYLMSKELDLPIPKQAALDIAYKMVGDDVGEAHARLESWRRALGRPFYDSRMLVSLAFPGDFNFESKDGDFCVEHGLLTKGTLTKKYLGANGSSLLKILMYRYNSEECGKFLDRLQFGATAYLTWRGFSVHADDFAHAGDEITREVRAKVLEAETVVRSIKNPRLRDARVRDVLNTAKDIGMALVKNSARDSNIAVMIDSGSKGDYFNVGQIRGTLGQQNLDGGFIVPQMNGGTRATLHYRADETDMRKIFESRGFVSSSFARGLSPREIVFHAMTGREGVCTSATLTAVSGYTTRRVMKFCEDMIVRADGSVGDSKGQVYDFAYGGTGILPAYKNFDFSHIIEKIGGVPAAKRRRVENEEEEHVEEPVEESDDDEE